MGIDFTPSSASSSSSASKATYGSINGGGYSSSSGGLGGFDLPYAAPVSAPVLSCKSAAGINTTSLFNINPKTNKFYQSHFPVTDISNLIGFTMSHYNDTETVSGKTEIKKDYDEITIYKASDDPQTGRPVIVVNLAGTEGKYSKSNTNANWIAAGNGEETDYERAVIAEIQKLVDQGKIPPDAIIDIMGHSLGGITANNISGRHDGKIELRDGKSLQIRNVVGCGTPKPAIWSDNVNYTYTNTWTDAVANIMTPLISNQWAKNPFGPAHLKEFKLYPVYGGNGGHDSYNEYDEYGNHGKSWNQLQNINYVPPGMNYTSLEPIDSASAPGNTGSEITQSGLGLLSMIEGWDNLVNIVSDSVDLGRDSIRSVQDVGQMGLETAEIGVDMFRLGFGDFSAIDRIKGHLHNWYSGLDDLKKDLVNAGKDFLGVVNNNALLVLGPLAKLLAVDLPIAQIAAEKIPELAKYLWDSSVDWGKTQINNATKIAEDTYQKGVNLWKNGVNLIEDKVKDGVQIVKNTANFIEDKIEDGVQVVKDTANFVENKVKDTGQMVENIGTNIWNAGKSFFGF